MNCEIQHNIHNVSVYTYCNCSFTPRSLIWISAKFRVVLFNTASWEAMKSKIVSWTCNPYLTWGTSLECYNCAIIKDDFDMKIYVMYQVVAKCYGLCHLTWIKAKKHIKQTFKNAHYGLEIIFKFYTELYWWMKNLERMSQQRKH